MVGEDNCLCSVGDCKLCVLPSLDSFGYDGERSEGLELLVDAPGKEIVIGGDVGEAFDVAEGAVACAVCG